MKMKMLSLSMVFVPFLAAFSAVDIDDEKYRVSLRTALIPSDSVSAPMLDGAGNVYYDDVNRYGYTKGSISLGDALNGEVQNINGNLLEQLEDYEENPLNALRIAPRVRVVSHAVSFNYEEVFKSYVLYVEDMTSDKITKEQFNSLKEAYATTRQANIGDIAKLNDAVSSINANSAKISASLNDTIRQLNILKSQPMEGMTEAQREALKNEILALTDKRIALALSSAAIDKVNEVKREVVFVGGGASVADFNFTNAMLKVSEYLGADASVTNNGMTFAAPKIRGQEIANITDYMKESGVMGFTDESKGITNSPFYYAFSVSNKYITANFDAPVGWADNKTICVTNGQLSLIQAYGAWQYINGKFYGCIVTLGSREVSFSDMAWTTAGNVYAVVNYSDPSSPTLTLSSTPVNDTGSTSSFLVGSIISPTQASWVRGTPIRIIIYE